MKNAVFKVLKKLFLWLLPQRFALPVRYYYRRKFGYLEREFEVLDRLAGRCKVAVDVGGNYGFYSYVLSKLCDRVEYFEPNPSLTGWIRACAARNVNINNVALSSSSGVDKLHIPVSEGRLQPDNASIGRTFSDELVIDVETRALDDYGLRDVSFMKIDVEGHELEVIEGAESTILLNRPVMLIEIVQTFLDFPAGTVFDRMEGLGYAAYYYLKGAFVTVDKDADGNWVLPGKLANNFIFIPNGLSPSDLGRTPGQGMEAG